MAQACAEPLLSDIASSMLKNQPFLFPTIQVIPIGGFREVVNFLSRYDALTGPGCNSYALLDRDVLEEIEQTWRDRENFEQLAWLRRSGNRISYLPWTPEVGLIELYLEDEHNFRSMLRDAFANQALHLEHGDIHEIQALEGGGKRNRCKSLTKEILESISAQTTRSKGEVTRSLGALLSREYLRRKREEAMRIYAPMIAD